MKTIAAELAYFMRGQARQNIRILVLYCGFLLLMILAYAAIFRFLMFHLEGLERPGESDPIIGPSPETVLADDMQLILIGSPAQEETFVRTFP